MEFVDYYEVMGVAEDAKAAEIKRAYRKLARKYHPDVSKEPDSEEQFKTLAEAYQVLKDPERRKEYDELRRYGTGSDHGYAPPPGWQSQAGFDPGDFSSAGTGGFSDFFEELFGQRAYTRQSHQGDAHFSSRGQDLHSHLSIPLKDAFHGASVPVELGRPVIQSDGRIQTEKRTVNVKIPKGVVDGQTIRLRGQGGPANGEAPAGDLYIKLEYEHDDMFVHDGKDITVTVPVSPWEAALGADIVVPTLAGNVNLVIPENSLTGKKFRLKGRGLPGSPPGNQYVVLDIVVPPATTDAQKDLYRQMRSLWTFNPRQKAGA